MLAVFITGDQGAMGDQSGIVYLTSGDSNEGTVMQEPDSAANSLSQQTPRESNLLLRVTKARAVKLMKRNGYCEFCKQGANNDGVIRHQCTVFYGESTYLRRPVDGQDQGVKER